jgi:hypothetical protein
MPGLRILYASHFQTGSCEVQRMPSIQNLGPTCGPSDMAPCRRRGSRLEQSLNYRLVAWGWPTEAR